MESDNNEGENKKRNRRDREERNAKMGIKIDYIKRAKYQFLSFLFLIDKNKYLPKIKNRQCNIKPEQLLNYINELGYKQQNLIDEELIIVPNL